jgi:hypothetical protein
MLKASSSKLFNSPRLRLLSQSLYSSPSTRGVTKPGRAAQSMAQMAERAASLPIDSDTSLEPFDASMPKAEINALSFLKVS